MRIVAVIGANFGDEGKGRIVDQLAATAESPVVVVRYNGGAQAGHTVVTPEGTRHVFAHFGSGTLVGASTWLSDFFIGNPFLWAMEHKDLSDKGIQPQCVMHPFMPLSTPYDMLINREVEIWRGQGRHGSCGYGVAETVERLCKTPYRTFLKDTRTKEFKDILSAIRNQYAIHRLAELGIKKPTDWFRESLASDGLLTQYYEELNLLLKATKQERTAYLKNFKTIIFEGSQGLCLDERHRFFPHVTRSKTGLSNVAHICCKLNIKNIEAIYVTRAYLTRHGAGPLPTEDQNLSYSDETNVENEWQGKLRFGYLDLDLLNESINNDIKTSTLNVNPSIAITCFDQISEKMKIKCKMQIKEISKDALPKLISSITGISKIIVSRLDRRSGKL